MTASLSNRASGQMISFAVYRQFNVASCYNLKTDIEVMRLDVSLYVAPLSRKRFMLTPGARFMSAERQPPVTPL